MPNIKDTSYRIATDKLPLGIKLLPHQRAIIHNMILMENNLIGTEKPYAMMSDKPGAGKTYAILAMIYFMDKILFQGKKKNVTLIVVPYNICTQWNKSMERIYGISGKLITYRNLIDYSDIMSLYTNPEELLRYDILLTTSLYFHNIASTLQSLKITIRRVFFDEADTIKNLLQIPLQCKMSWFVSASMESLFEKGSTVSIGSYKLSLEHLKIHDIACDIEFINSNIILEDFIVHNIECNNVYYKLLMDLVPSTQYEKISAMDYSFIRSEFLSMTDVYDTEYSICLYIHKETIIRKDTYLKTIQDLEKEYKRYVQRELLKEANEIKAQISNIQKYINECDRKLSIIKYFSSKYDISNEFECKGKPNDVKLDKIKEAIIYITTQNTRAQCIIFTNHDALYRLLFPFFQRSNITYKFLDGGNIQDMDRIIESYKRREYTILLADSSMYSCGMNLENTSDILFIHEMDKQREKQVIGRAQRYGRDGVLNVWYFNYNTKK